MLEIGCGTGLLTFRVAPYVRSVLAVDASHGMISALKSKLSSLTNETPRNVQPLCLMLVDPEDPALPPVRSIDDTLDANPSKVLQGSRRKFDLVISHLVLHHIADLGALLQTMHGSLKPNGRVALTDFEDFGSDARKFHPISKMAGVERNGIKREWFAELMQRAGFVDVDVGVGWVMRKAVERYDGEWDSGRPADAEEMDFPFLLCRGRRP